MKYSKFFGKTIKENPRDASIISHKLLIKGGFIRESVAGRYFFLPLGQRVMDKIVKIVEEEMANINCQKMLVPILQPIELWQETNRNKSGGYELMTVTDRRGAVFTPGGTGEEMFSDVVRKFQISYKDLPISVYQFGYKFRDEARAKGGLMRTREFLMKDAYNFTKNKDEFEKTYYEFVEAYLKIFSRIGLETKAAPADNGYYGGEYAHEFLVDLKDGEGAYYESEDGKYFAHEDIAVFQKTTSGMDEDIKPLETISQPKWVETMQDNQKHYNLPESRFLKNVVYKNVDTNEIIIAVIRGDLSVNKNKLEHTLCTVGLLEDATEQDLSRFGAIPGYVHSWGYEEFDFVKFVVDDSVLKSRNLIGGSKTDDTDTINVNYERDFKHQIVADIAMAEEGFLSQGTKSKLVKKKAVEVGNTFNLEYFYSDKMKNLTFINEKGKSQKYYMGSYGIGIARSMATVVEKHYDERGIIWPSSISPFKFHLVTIAKNTEEMAFIKSSELYEILQNKGIEVIWDERLDVSTGEKFADSDLIGCTFRVVISAKSLEKGGFEVKNRAELESKILTVEEILQL